jgi:hypothetical protein
VALRRASQPDDERGPARVRVTLRPIVDRVVAATLRPLDRAFDQVFLGGMDVRSVAEGEELLAAMSAGEPTPSKVGTWVALAAALRPVVVRVAKTTGRAGRVMRFSGAGRVAALGVTATVAAGRVVDASRHGVGELQVMAAFLAERVRRAGRQPSRQAVEAAALSLYVSPSRRPVLTQSRHAAVGGAARRWVLDAMRPDAEESRRRRSRARLKAIANLSDQELLRLVDVIPATIRDEEHPAIGR